MNKPCLHTCPHVCRIPMHTCPQPFYSQCSGQRLKHSASKQQPHHGLCHRSLPPKLIYLSLHGPTEFLLFQKDTNPFADFDLHTDHSLFAELTCLADPGSRHHLATSVMSHLRWSLPMFPKRRFLLASVTADHYHCLFPFFSALSNLLPPCPLGLSSHMGPKTLTLL